MANFSKLSNDLKALSIPDLSILAVAYELISEEGNESLIRKEPINTKLIQKENSQKTNKENSKTPNEDNEFEEVKSKRRPKDNKDKFEDEGEWITPENINEKLNQNIETDKASIEQVIIKTFVTSGDFTIQNVALKMGIPILNIEGFQVKCIKNYILKCFSCYEFIYDTSKLFCQNCGYNTLMKIGYTINEDGQMKIFDKKAQPRNRGTQFDLPKPSTGKKATIFILAEDQLPKNKKEINIEQQLDRILDNYETYRDLHSQQNTFQSNATSKNLVWGYPKQNPNVSKKYYSKKKNK